MARAAARYVPDRGDAVWLDFDPTLGSEQRGRRPALVLSPLSYNRIVGLFVVCPITNQSKGFAFEVTIPPKLAVGGVILSDHVKSLDYRQRNVELICRLPSEVVNDVLAKLNTLIGILA